MKKCLCGCRMSIIKRPGETAYQVSNRRFFDRSHYIRYRKNTGAWFKDTSKLKGKRAKTMLHEEVKICKQCGKPKMNLHRHGFGVTDAFYMCIHGLKWNEQRKAYI